MRLRNVVLLYRVRLRDRLVQELFAILGIAVGVALLFASQIASTSLDGSVQQLASGIVGGMRFQLAARSPLGFEQRLLGEVQRLPGVQSAVPVLEANADVIGPKGEQAVDLLSTDPHFAHLGGPLLRRFTAAQLERQQAFALPLPLAQSVGLASLQSAELQIGARVEPAFLGAVLLRSDIGSLVDSGVAIAPIAYAQQLTGMRGRLTSIFVRPDAGHDGEVRTGLLRLAAGRLNVQPADREPMLFRQAAGPENQSALLFAAISALVGFLFAFNAMLLTVPQRRSLVEDLRLDGYTRRMILEILLFDALVLGMVASLLGLALGDLLSLALFRGNPGYLVFAFASGSLRIVTWQSVAVAAGGGLLAALVGVLAPLWANVFSPLGLRPDRGTWGPGAVTAALLGGMTCLVLTTVILAIAPQEAVLGIVSLVAALLLLLPSLVYTAVLAFDHLQRSIGGAASQLAVVELRSEASRARSLAIAATGAIAVFGSVAIQGAHANLQRGIDESTQAVNAFSEWWVAPSGLSNLLATTPFSDASARALARLPGVRAVSVYRGGFLDYGARRVWVLAPPRTATQPISSSQLVQGDLALATARFRRGGWVVISQAIAHEHDLRIGQWLTLPSPRPTAFRVAALITNVGWPPGAIVLNAEDYARAWASTDASAYNLVLAPGVPAQRFRREVRDALGPTSGLVAETMRQREARGHVTSREGLSRLTQISALVLLAAMLAMAAAMGSMIWQRRRRLADMKVDGFGRGVLWRALLVESAVLLGEGCSIGAVFGLYGQLLLSHTLAVVTGFPIVYSVGALVALGSFALVTTVAVLILTVPGYLAVRVRPAIILQD
jgi:putative ABC transport system permease protein